MTDRTMLVPDSSHPITIAAQPSRVTVASGSLHIGETGAALTLSEASYPPVPYIPRGDIDMSLLERSDHVTWCPYKGEASYYSIPALGERGRNCVWTYEEPFAAVAAIAGHLAFYADRVSITRAEQHSPSE